MKLCFYTLLAYDYKLSYASILSYYNIADEIILAVDSARLSWSGKPFEFDEKAVNNFILRIDKNKKIKLVQQPFYNPALDVTDNETNERNQISKLFPADSTIIAINSDEVLLNPDEFWMWLSSYDDNKDIEAIEYRDPVLKE